MAHCDDDAYVLPQLSRIEYELLSWEEPSAALAAVDQVSMAVLLHFSDSGSLRFHWTATPPIERLTIGEWKPGDPIPETKRADVTHRWPGFAADTLLHYRFSLMEGGTGPEPWSCRLIFRSGRSLVIALGEFDREGITYIPDNLVVTATREVAESYRPIRAWDHAWGSDEPGRDA